MCRLLCVQNTTAFDIADHLSIFARIARDSREYQGHGWGCSWLENGEWQVYRNIKPIWEDSMRKFGKTSLLLAHARSAFRDEGIVVDNNMPFISRDTSFIFNGELQGVRIREAGRIGAEKIFNYIQRFNKGDTHTALKKGIGIIKKRTRYIRAMNIIMAQPTSINISSIFSQEPDYFQLHHKDNGQQIIICSQPYPGEPDWKVIENHTTFQITPK